MLPSLITDAAVCNLNSQELLSSPGDDAAASADSESILHTKAVRYYYQSIAWLQRLWQVSHHKILPVHHQLCLAVLITHDLALCCTCQLCPVALASHYAEQAGLLCNLIHAAAYLIELSMYDAGSKQPTGRCESARGTAESAPVRAPAVPSEVPARHAGSSQQAARLADSAVCHPVCICYQHQPAACSGAEHKRPLPLPIAIHFCLKPLQMCHGLATQGKRRQLYWVLPTESAASCAEFNLNTLCAGS